MSVKLDRQIAPTGTKFRLRPLPSYAGVAELSTPETVTLSVPVGSVLAGPEDDRYYTIDASNKLPYDENSGPPYTGPANPKVQPGPGGHFDHLAENSREFLVATMYATVRRVLDIWQDYLGRRIEWQFTADFARMELIPLINWDNAQSGYGFLEFGYGRGPDGIDFTRPYCENFDVLSHELGHAIIFAEVGVPQSNTNRTFDYGGFHESAGDLCAIVSLLHFNTVVDHLLKKSHGNLFTVNELSRIGELSASSQIRLALNSLKMSNVGNEPHDRSQPLTGAFFDILVEIYQRILVEDNVITQSLADRSLGPQGTSPTAGLLQPEFDAAYAANPAGFKTGLLKARDEFARLLAAVWTHTSPNRLTYAGLAKTAILQDQILSNGKNVNGIRASFKWREISVPAPSPIRALFRVDRFPADVPAPLVPETGAALAGKREPVAVYANVAAATSRLSSKEKAMKGKKKG
ncbi:MAG TPA: hypothetical protein VGO11_06400 [Chthoniobacteraceae bacterium]|jgi:hypothetical protein|nr:hypothetical protein [Chthoniobacteraceae bacterium]